MTNTDIRKFYFAKIDKSSQDGELANSICRFCRGKGCTKCHNVGKQPFKFEVEGVHYQIPLWVLNKEGIHEFLKGVMPSFPVDAEGKPLSMGNGRRSATDDQVREYLDELYQAALYSDILIEEWEKSREED